MQKYEDFLKQKEIMDSPSGFHVEPSNLHPALFDWQALLVSWALRRGRAALFEGCGLGKTLQQLVWAKEVCKFSQGPVIGLAPLAVSEQTVREGKKFGIEVNLCRSKDDVREGINITNYEKMHKFDLSVFAGVFIDESSILKHFTAVTRNALINAFQNTPYRLACTATPAPNDWDELGNHAEFLGVMTLSEMRATFFINDTSHTGNWRLKGHIKDNYFWKWLSSWSVMMEKPSDLGFDDNGFILPEITYHEHIIKYKEKNFASGANGKVGFFVMPAGDLNSRRKVRKDTIELRCHAAADIINATDNIWVIWCGLNNEGELLSKLIEGSVEVAGRHTDEIKSQRMFGFAEGKIKRLITKPKIAGHGMNWQI